ncbi:pleckstrin homology domain-containing family J member 1-like isoform X2 [Myzus persicae]|uniref:pleckstrin homology domain-containing family J member 1-like isoform X2 n=1 Tax=Myzus persicae TaxID=13164 RepID=UPI000B934458|nr:pleckstrin homology domain-containing family J member 1-like isoform X2 [Myzus persicae]
MRFNNKEMIHVSHSNPALEGRMSYAKMSNGYASKGFKERWFRLKYNLLFYFKINGFGQVDLHQPAGVFVLENSIVRLENNMPGTLFSFSLSFKDEPDKKYIISSQSEDHVHQWIKCIQSSTYEYMRTRMTSIQKKIVELTGRDPLLMYPEEGKKIGRTKRSVADEDDSDLFFNPPTDPLPPPRHKHDASKTAVSNLIEL